jgi:integrase
VADATAHRFRHTLATLYLTRYPGDETGLRRILGHVSHELLRTYVHLASITIAQRAGRVAPTSAWLYERDA